MCCFSGTASVKSVANTKIFARVEGHRQALAYQMEFDADEPVAMILPIPATTGPESEVITFVTLPNDFFTQIEGAFPVIAPDLEFRWNRGDPTAAAHFEPPPLVVHQVGDFVASFVPRIGDFGRLDARFRLAPETWARIPGYQDFGFVVFQLAELRGQPRPMGFWFHTTQPQSVFFPTLHIHDGTVHSNEHFDHDLYLQSPTFDDDTATYTREPTAARGFAQSADRARAFVATGIGVGGMIAGDSYLHHRRLEGRWPNRDTIVSLAETSASTIAKMRSRLPGFLFLGAPIAGVLVWLQHRKNLLKRTGDK